MSSLPVAISGFLITPREQAHEAKVEAVIKLGNESYRCYITKRIPVNHPERPYSNSLLAAVASIYGGRMVVGELLDFTEKSGVRLTDFILEDPLGSFRYLADMCAAELRHSQMSGQDVQIAIRVACMKKLVDSLPPFMSDSVPGMIRSLLTGTLQTLESMSIPCRRECA